MALLLLFIHGISKKMKDVMKIRENVKFFLMGYARVIRSQLLKFIAHIYPTGF